MSERDEPDLPALSRRAAGIASVWVVAVVLLHLAVRELGLRLVQ